MDKITRKQKLFCEYYVGSLNASDAYKKTYKNDNNDTCKVNACKLLKKPEIQEYIQDLMKDFDNEIVASQNEVLKFLTDVMRGNIKDQFDLDAPLKERNRAAELLGKKYNIFVETQNVKLSGKVKSESNNPFEGLTTEQLLKIINKDKNE